MHKVYSYVFYKFIDEAELFKRAGFSIEAILKDEALNAHGATEDIVRIIITDKEWKILNKKDIEKHE